MEATEETSMNRTLGLSLFAISAAWLLLLKSRSAPQRLASVHEAASRLRAAWANNHTTA
jgi:hypothetical protein